MANSEHLAILKQGVVAWNEWKQQHPLTVPDLSMMAEFPILADLAGADLRNTKVFRANLSATRLTGADFRGADLSFANLSKAELAGANFRDATLGYTLLGGVDLSHYRA